MTTRRIALPAFSAAIYLAIAAEAMAYTYTFRLPMTINHVHLNTVSAFCRDVNWDGTANSGTTVTVNSASICLVSRIIVDGKYNGQSVHYEIATGAAPSLTFYDRDGQLCVDIVGQTICQPYRP